MLRTIQIAPSFAGSCSPAGGTCQPTQTTLPWLRQGATALRTVSEAWDECVAAHYSYRQLTSRGVSPETAIREALGFGPAPAHERPERASPLGFAGRT
jgi:hypothetical protein